jgi:sugar phosphate isomerase/epimerase
MKEDCTEVLEKLGKMGYQEIESFPSAKGHYWGRTAKDFFSLASGNGLKVVSTHIPLGLPANPEQDKLATLKNGFEAFVEAFAKEGGAFIVCPYIDKSLRTTLDSYHRIADELNKAGETCKKYGVTFAYHNHDFEFLTVEGAIPYHELLKRTDAGLVKMELDLYWAARAGQNITDLFKEFPGRFPLVHVKDMAATDKATVEVGTGVINFNDIFAQSGKAGIKHYFVEQDNCPGDPLESVKKSLENVRKLEF